MPKELECRAVNGERLPLHPLWNRRFSTKFNGVSYVTQRGAEALYSEEGKAQVSALVSHYMENARILREAVTDSGLAVYGGVNAPYIWVRGPEGVTSWEIFDRLLQRTPHCRHARQRFWDVRRRLLPHLRIQQPRQRRRGRTKILRHRVVAT